MKIKKIVSTLLSMVLVAGIMPTVTLGQGIVMAAEGDVAINAVNFPDAYFRNYVATNFDTDRNNILSSVEISLVTSIEVQGSFNWPDDGFTPVVSSVKGVEFFTNLESLNCSNNSLTELDVSNNTKLNDLNCRWNNLTTLDVSANTNLKGLDCDFNKLATLDISNNLNLEYLSCEDNNLVSLDVGNNVNLTSLNCAGNNLSSLDISNSLNLERLECQNNNLTSLDVRNHINLINLAFDYNNISSIDTSNNTKLEYLSCNYNNLTSLVVANCPELYGLFCSMNNITELDLSNNSGLYSLRCFGNPIDRLDVSNCPELCGYVTHGCYTNPEIYGAGSSEGYDGNYVTVPVDAVMYRNPAGGYHGLMVDMQTTVVINGKEYIPNESVELEHFVRRLYYFVLGRSAEAAEVEFWITNLSNGSSTGASVADGFLNSPEFLNQNRTNGEFLSVLYNVFFNRYFSEEEGEFWITALDNGYSKEDIIKGFEDSTEWANICFMYGIASGGNGTPNIRVEPNEAIIDFATRFYTTCLAREGEEDGIFYWADLLANMQVTGSEAASVFFFGPEFVGQNNSDEVFVARLYETFMGRSGEASEISFWVEFMNNGQTRQTVFDGFASSPEFSNLCHEAGILP